MDSFLVEHSDEWRLSNLDSSPLRTFLELQNQQLDREHRLDNAHHALHSERVEHEPCDF